MKEHRTNRHVVKVERFLCACKCYSLLIYFEKYLAQAIVSFVNCFLRMAGIYFLAAVNSFSRGSAHLCELLYVSSENKRPGDTPESMDEGQKRYTGDRREENERILYARVVSRDLY